MPQDITIKITDRKGVQHEVLAPTAFCGRPQLVELVLLALGR